MRVESVGEVAAVVNLPQRTPVASAPKTVNNEPLVLYNNKGLLEVYCWYPKLVNEEA